MTRAELGGRSVSRKSSPPAVVGKRCGVAVRVLDAQQVIFCVIAVLRDVVVGIGDRHQPVRIVTRVTGCPAVLIGGRDAPSAIIVDETGRCLSEPWSSISYQVYSEEAADNVI